MVGPIVFVYLLGTYKTIYYNFLGQNPEVEVQIFHSPQTKVSIICLGSTSKRTPAHHRGQRYLRGQLNYFEFSKLQVTYNAKNFHNRFKHFTVDKKSVGSSPTPLTQVTYNMIHIIIRVCHATFQTICTVTTLIWGGGEISNLFE